MAVPVAIQVPLEDSLHRLEVNPLYILRELFTYLTGGGGALACPFLPISTFVPTRLLAPNTHALSSAPAAALDALATESVELSEGETASSDRVPLSQKTVRVRRMRAGKVVVNENAAR